MNMHEYADNRNEFSTLVGWLDHGNHAFRRACVSADADSGLVNVRDGGLYVIYGHLAVCRCGANTGFTHRVRRRTLKAVEVITVLEDSSAASAQAGDDDCHGEPLFASDLFGLVTLEDGDSVWIDAKPASAVYRPNGASFFGLYRL